MSHHCPHCGESIVFSHNCHLAPDTKTEASQPTACQLTNADMCPNCLSKMEGLSIGSLVSHSLGLCKKPADPSSQPTPQCPHGFGPSTPCPQCGTYVEFANSAVAPTTTPRIDKAFLVKIEMHTTDAYMALDSPQLVRDAIGEALEKFKLQEEVDFTLEVNRVYEN